MGDLRSAEPRGPAFAPIATLCITGLPSDATSVELPPRVGSDPTGRPTANSNDLSFLSGNLDSIYPSIAYDLSAVPRLRYHRNAMACRGTTSSGMRSARVNSQKTAGATALLVEVGRDA